MRKQLFALAAVASALIATPAFAQNDSGLRLGLRTGYSLPLGEAVENGNLDELYDGVVPIWIDLGYRLNPNLALGGFFQYGIGLMNENECDEGCSGYSLRFGVEATYHFAPTSPMSPWAGIGIGYERSGMTFDDGDRIEVDVSFNGLEFVNLQAGADFRIAPAVSVGPFLSISVAQFSTRKVSGGTDGFQISGSNDIKDRGIHQWLQLGVRGSFDL